MNSTAPDGVPYEEVTAAERIIDEP